MSPRRRQLRMSLWLSESLEPLQLASDEYTDGEHVATFVNSFGTGMPLELAVAKLLSTAQMWKAGIELDGHQLELEGQGEDGDPF